MATPAPYRERATMSVLFTTSLVSATTGKGRVDFYHDDRRFTQCSPEEARRWARNIFEVVEAADTDAFLLSYLSQEMGMPERDAGKMVGLFRQWRDREREANTE